MSQIHVAMPYPQRPSMSGRRTITTKASFSDDEITPCSSPAPEPQEPIAAFSPPQQQQPPQGHHHQDQGRMSSSSSIVRSLTSRSRRGSSSRKASMQVGGGGSGAGAWHFDPTDGEHMDDSQLWQRMLAIQRTFHCYNSARMSAALLELEMGVDIRHLAPSRSCLDLINDSISDMDAEERERLMEWLHENSSKRKRSGIWRRSIAF